MRVSAENGENEIGPATGYSVEDERQKLLRYRALPFQPFQAGCDSGLTGLCSCFTHASSLSVPLSRRQYIVTKRNASFRCRGCTNTSQALRACFCNFSSVIRVIHPIVVNRQDSLHGNHVPAAGLMGERAAGRGVNDLILRAAAATFIEGNLMLLIGRIPTNILLQPKLSA